MSDVAEGLEVARLDGLRPADETTSLRVYLGALWARRDYIVNVSRGQLRSQQMNTVLGNLWHLLNPMLQIGVYYLIFGVVLGVDRGVPNFIAFIAVGLFAFQFSSRATMQGARAITSNQSLLRSVWFPRALLPCTSTLTVFLSYLPAVAVMFGVCLATGEAPRWSWLLLPPLVLIQTLFNFGLALMAARASAKYLDIQQLLPFVFRLLTYASGVLFYVDEYVTDSTWRLLFELNPFYAFVSLYRVVVLSYPLNDHTLLVAPTATVIALVFGFWWFRRAEREYGHV